MTTTIRLPERLVETIDTIVSTDYRYTSRRHLLECALREWLEEHWSSRQAEGARGVGNSDSAPVEN
jgi:Arc/MetJ-type ribon-helix-helix transcriptional regulator